MSWFEDALVELDSNSEKFSTERQMFWEGQYAKARLNAIYAIGRELNGRNLKILWLCARQLEERQREEIENNGENTLEEV